MQLQGSVFSNSYQKNEVQQVQTSGSWRIDGCVLEQSNEQAT